MDFGSIIAIIVAIAAIIVAVMAILSARHAISVNGRSQAERYGALTESVGNIQKKLDDENFGLGALKDGISSMRNHCTLVSTGLAARVEQNSKEIEELKGKRRKRS